MLFCKAGKGNCVCICMCVCACVCDAVLCTLHFSIDAVFPLQYKKGINVVLVSQRGYRARPPQMKREGYLLLKRANTEGRAHC